MKKQTHLFFFILFTISLSAQQEHLEPFKLMLESDAIVFGRLEADSGKVLLVEFLDAYKGNFGLGQDRFLRVKDEITLGCGFTKDATEEMEYGIFFLEEDSTQWQMVEPNFVIKFFNDNGTLLLNDCEFTSKSRDWSLNLKQFLQEFHLDAQGHILAQRSASEALEGSFLPLPHECYRLFYPQLKSIKKTKLNCLQETLALPQQEVNPKDTMIFSIAETMSSPAQSIDSLILEVSLALTEKHRDLVKSGVQETMYFEVVIEKDGRISRITPLRASNQLLAQSAKLYLSEMPAWNPAQHHGKAVRSKINLPIRFPTQANR